LLGIVAHDVRSPLHTISLAATVVERELLECGSTQGVASLRRIERAAERANRLIEDLLDTTRIEAGALRVSSESLSPGAIVAEAVEAQGLAAVAAGVELETDLAQGLPSIRADRDRLLQVFENLLGNALKYTPAGGTIVVGVAPREQDVLFRVADTGRGIATESLPRIFDRFWQAKRPARRGAGLGLPICKGIVESHGGHIWVESTEGQGATFYFTMPLAHATSR
jgi:signal transduction histidine kinase